MGPRRRLALSLTVTGLALLGTGASAVEAAPFQGVEETLSSRSGASSYQLSVTHEPYTNLWDASGSLANGVTSLLAQRWNAESGSAASKRSLVTEHARDVKDGHHSLKPAHSRRRSAASRSEGTGQCQEKRSGVKDLLTGVGSGMHDLVNGVADGTEALVDGVVAGVDGVVGGLTDVLTATVTWLFDQSWGISVSNAENEAFDNEVSHSHRSNMG